MGKRIAITDTHLDLVLFAGPVSSEGRAVAQLVPRNEDTVLIGSTRTTHQEAIFDLVYQLDDMLGTLKDIARKQEG